MKIALACDHAGFEKLADLQTFLYGLGHDCQNFGPTSLNPNDDYPDFVVPAVKAVASGSFERAIIIGGSGQGEAMDANRIRGVRCAVFYGSVIPKSSVDINGKKSHDPYEIIRLSRQHNDSNVLSLGARFMSQQEMHQAVKIWLETDFSNDDRHKRRIAKLDKENA